MISNDNFENLRNDYKPVHIEILFVGESRPQGGTFFYQGDSALYRETKKAFDEYLSKSTFTLRNFKKWNCWLYDICKEPVNGVVQTERRTRIRQNIPRFVEIVTEIAPKIIIVCKKTLIEPEIRQSDIMKAFNDEENIFFLPFPGNGNQKKYREGLIRILTTIHFNTIVANSY